MPMLSAVECTVFTRDCERCRGCHTSERVRERGKRDAQDTVSPTYDNTNMHTTVNAQTERRKKLLARIHSRQRDWCDRLVRCRLAYETGVIDWTALMCVNSFADIVVSSLSVLSPSSSPHNHGSESTATPTAVCAAAAAAAICAGQDTKSSRERAHNLSILIHAHELFDRSASVIAQPPQYDPNQQQHQQPQYAQQPQQVSGRSWRWRYHL